jgi:hypothetical protein
VLKSEADHTFRDVGFPWKMKHTIIPYGFTCTTAIPHTYHVTYTYLFIYFFTGEDLTGGFPHIAGRGLPLKDEAHYYTLRFYLYHRHSPYLPRYRKLIIYIYLFLRARNLIRACYTLLVVRLPLYKIRSSAPHSKNTEASPVAVSMKELRNP